MRKLFSPFVVLILITSILGNERAAKSEDAEEEKEVSSAVEYYELGRKAYLMLSLQEAITYYNKAIEADPNFAPAYAGLGEAYSFIGHFKREDREEYEDAYNESHENLLKAIKLDKSKMECQRALALSYLHLKRTKDAEAAVRQALEMNPDDAESYYILWAASGKSPDSPHIAKALELNPRLVMAHLDMGTGYFFQKGDYEKAEGYYRQAVEINPNLARAYNHLGTALRTQGSFNPAVSEYIKAVQIDPGFAPAHINLGATLFYMGKYEDAIAHLTKALSLNLNYPDAYYFLANAHERAGNPEEAMRNYQIFVALVSKEEKYSSYITNAKGSMAKLGNGMKAETEGLEK